MALIVSSIVIGLLVFVRNCEKNNPNIESYNTKCNFKSVQSHSGIMPMNRNVKANQVSEDWTVIFLQSVLFSTSTVWNFGICVKATNSFGWAWTTALFFEPVLTSKLWTAKWVGNSEVGLKIIEVPLFHRNDVASIPFFVYLDGTGILHRADGQVAHAFPGTGHKK